MAVHEGMGNTGFSGLSCVETENKLVGEGGREGEIKLESGVFFAQVEFFFCQTTVRTFGPRFGT